MILRLGFILNPYAGIGGPLAQKGSDFISLQTAAAEGAIPLRAPSRAEKFWQVLMPVISQLDIVSAPAIMGGDWLTLWNIPHALCDYPLASQSTAQDTQVIAKSIVDRGVDILLFVGGDGTARDIYSAVGEQALVLGIPAGVKMHSGVYAVNPQSAAGLIKDILTGALIAESLQEVRDIDEILLAKSIVKAKCFGYMRVPRSTEYIQSVKHGGEESDAMAVLDIAEYLKSSLSFESLIIFAPGSTTHQILFEWGYEGTLLGVDILHPEQGLIVDVNAEQLMQVVSNFKGDVNLVLTAIGGQGHIIGRGNQQLTPEVLKIIGRDHVHVVATKRKLSTLESRPLLMDSGDPELDKYWQGLIRVIVGYNDIILYPVGFFKDFNDVR